MKVLNDLGLNISHQVALLVTQYQLNVEMLSSSLWGQLPSQLYTHLMVHLPSPCHPNLASRRLEERMSETCYVKEGDIPVFPCPPSQSSLHRRQSGWPSMQCSKMQTGMCHILLYQARVEPDGASRPGYLLPSRSVTV